MTEQHRRVINMKTQRSKKARGVIAAMAVLPWHLA